MAKYAPEQNVQERLPSLQIIHYELIPHHHHPPTTTTNGGHFVQGTVGVGGSGAVS